MYLLCLLHLHLDPSVVHISSNALDKKVTPIISFPKPIFKIINMCLEFPLSLMPLFANGILVGIKYTLRISRIKNNITWAKLTCIPILLMTSSWGIQLILI